MFNTSINDNLLTLLYDINPNIKYIFENVDFILIEYQMIDLLFFFI